MYPCAHVSQRKEDVAECIRVLMFLRERRMLLNVSVCSCFSEKGGCCSSLHASFSLFNLSLSIREVVNSCLYVLLPCTVLMKSCTAEL